MLLRAAVNPLRPGLPKICCIDATANCANNDAMLKFLWPPYGIGQTIIFLPCGYFFLSFFFLFLFLA